MSGPRTSWPAAGLAPGYADPRVIEAFGFLESVASGVQGEPGFRAPLAVARVRETIMRPWDSEHWAPMTYEE